ncbi:hypothetical protein SARC_06000 [Sphaeroforma arctica JP610]|uniref:Uncharacterized protein n=1 Tax=Sphaeroforma arctica JP610 TaxID=667725 RepID=A0A0L0FXY5_9EUKA|nr:hypothetical protein SARC_06000 [Sphaeroforma arctica JP610]KNC81690.1 hypothetical protein SARC_06000 [Sphaeroforma arctica JP610]|eukprot:XP_014155592.1 hypothetical protein SARC_06000 [Sphaeroforma arctica JP610]
MGLMDCPPELNQSKTQQKEIPCPPLARQAEHRPKVNLDGCLYSTILLFHDGEVLNGHKHHMCVCQKGFKCVGCADTCTLNGLSLFHPGEGINCVPVASPSPNNKSFWRRTWSHITGDATMEAAIAACFAAIVFAGKKAVTKWHKNQEADPIAESKDKEAVPDGAARTEPDEHTALVVQT